MITVRVSMKGTGRPLKRVPVALEFDADGSVSEIVPTDGTGRAAFSAAPSTGKVVVNGLERYHGRLEGEIAIALWSITEAEDASCGAPRPDMGGDTSYPGMPTCSLWVDGNPVLTDSEGYLVRLADRSEAFARHQAAADGLILTDAHWEVIRFLRAFFEQRGVQASVRDMIKFFRGRWGSQRGVSRRLHDMFPLGGPQKQGNRLAGLLKTKGEH